MTSTSSVDAAAIQALVTEALSATGALPVESRVTELDEQLRAEINRLIPIVQDKVDALNRGTREWYGAQSSIDWARDAVLVKLPEGGRLAGALHIGELARRLCDLQQREGVES